MDTACIAYAHRMYTVCTPYAHRTHTVCYAHTVCTHVCPPSSHQVHAWVQLHFRTLKQRQAALLGIPPHKFTSKL